MAKPTSPFTLKINEIKRLYCDPRRLSAVYWPRHLRIVLKQLVEVVNDHLTKEWETQLKNEFGTDRQAVIRSLTEPMTAGLTVECKKAIVALLDRIATSSDAIPRGKSPFYVANLEQSGERASWPSGIIRSADLYADMHRRTLRLDVVNFLIQAMQSTLDRKRVKLNLRPVKAADIDRVDKVICLRVANMDEATKLEKYLETVSAQQQREPEWTGLSPSAVCYTQMGGHMVHNLRQDALESAI